MARYSAALSASGRILASTRSARRRPLGSSRSGTVGWSRPIRWWPEACYEAASTAERRTVHTALAELARDVEERARHLALSAAAGDHEVATTLHDAANPAAGGCERLGGADLARLAVDHTADDDPQRWARLLLLGDLLFRTGDSSAAVETLERVQAGAVARSDHGAGCSTCWPR